MNRFMPHKVTQFGLMLGSLCQTSVWAEVQMTRAVNVSSTSISFAASSDEPVTGVALRVYSDAAGANEITGQFQVDIPSASVFFAHDVGTAVARVSGLAPSTSYFFALDITTATSTTTIPASGAGLQTSSAQSIDKASQLNAGDAFSNDLVRFVTKSPGGFAPVNGLLTFLDIPGSGQNAIAAFPEPGNNNEAALDLSNLFDAGGNSYEVFDNTPLRIRQWRGILCGPSEQEMTVYRRSDTHPETPRVAAATEATLCFASDTVCDGRLDVLDFQFVLNAVNAQSDDCRYSPQVDVDGSGLVDSDDYAEIVNRLGDIEPF